MTILLPGDVLVQPKGWLHWVHNRELSLSVPCAMLGEAFRPLRRTYVTWLCIK